MQGHLRGAAPVGTPVGVDMPCGNIRERNRGHVGRVHRRGRFRLQLRVRLGQDRRCRIALDRLNWPSGGQGQQVAADATTQIGRQFTPRKSTGLISGNPGVGRLLQALRGEEHPLGQGKLFPRRFAQLNLLENQVHARGRQSFTQLAGQPNQAVLA